MLEVVESLLEAARRSGNPDEPFYYLGGPMTGISQFNFPTFLEAAADLRAAGKNIISPAEIDKADTFAAAMASPDGAPGSGAANGESYEDFLGRDLILCSLPTCKGMICLTGWHDSRGAGGESWVIGFLKREMYEYNTPARRKLHSVPIITPIERDARIEALGGSLGYMGVLPIGQPGVLTAGLEDTEIIDAEIVNE